MNDKTKKKDLRGNLNKAERKALEKARPKVDLERELGPLEEGETYYWDGKEFSIRKKSEVGKTNPRIKGIDRTEEYFDFKKGKKDEGYKVMEAAKGGMVKKYMGGGSVHKKKNKMITTRGWGASRKT